MPQQNKIGIKILDKRPEAKWKAGESIEHLMARKQFIESSVIPVARDATGKAIQFADMDANGDGTFTAAELQAALKSPILQMTQNKRVLETLENKAAQSIKEKTPVADVAALHKEFLQPHTIERANGTIVPAIKGTMQAKEFERLDKNNDGKVSRGEFIFDQIENIHEAPQKPQDNLPAKPPKKSAPARGGGGRAIIA